MLKIYGGDLSSPANKVRFVANSLGLQYEYIQIKIREGQNRTPEFLKLHPAGKIPVIDDDGFVLFESNAIIRYLARKQKSPLYPSDLKQRAVVEQWMDFSSIHVGDAVSRLFYNRVLAPMIKVPVNEQSIQDGINFLSRFLPIVNNQLGENFYLAGQEVSLADIVLLAVLDPCEVSGIDISSYSNIVKWRNALKQKDFYTKCHKEYGESLKQRVS